MDCPYFTVTNYSAFNSDMVNYGKEGPPERLITAYEFEFYTEDCAGGLFIDGVLYRAKKGFFSCTKPGQRQRMLLPYKCYFFNICTQDEQLCEFLDNLPDFSVLWNMDEVMAVFRELLSVEATGLLENRLHMESCICRILSLVAQARPLTAESGENKALLHRKNLQLADKYIREHYTEEITLETLAQMCGLHPNYFHRLYTEAFGRTPAQRLLSCRLAAAKMALLTQNVSMSEIAAKCGFSSATYFGYKFKEVVGYTPLQYRKRQLSRR